VFRTGDGLTGSAGFSGGVVSVTVLADRRLPAPLAAALAVPFRYDRGAGVEFEPFSAFLPAEETTAWFRAWTGNSELSGDEFRVFGRDRSGGHAAFWLVRPHRPLVDQPVVFLGSEGETGVVARDLADFLWLLAGGFGPLEAISPEPGWTARPNEELAAIAERFAPPGRRQSPAAVIECATGEFPDFTDTIVDLCR
jgi:hypothetical protein